MDSESPVVNREEIERVLCQIAEIEAARIVSDKNDRIEELHVLANDSKGPRQIVRDIESLLMARFGIAIDHKKISIAQVGEIKQTKKSSLRTHERLKIAGINIDIAGQEATYEINLTQNGTSHTGTASGPCTQNGRLRLAALAALDAARKRAPEDCNYALEHIEILPITNAKIALVCVSAMTRTGEEIFAGSAVVKFNEGDSIVKATLAAINRHMILEP
jgi:hypothetical protein